MIIAGAGIAGITCAHQLLEAGYNVQLLEASSHIGGRLKELPSNLAR